MVPALRTDIFFMVSLLPVASVGAGRGGPPRSNPANYAGGKRPRTSTT